MRAVTVYAPNRLRTRVAMVASDWPIPYNLRRRVLTNTQVYNPLIVHKKRRISSRTRRTVTVPAPSFKGLLHPHFWKMIFTIVQYSALLSNHMRTRKLGS